jgi:hypothetical protein
MPPIPKVNKQDGNESKSSKNFIKENINKIVNCLPTCPRRYIVSDRKGNKFLIDGSGLQKDFIYKKVIKQNFCIHFVASVAQHRTEKRFCFVMENE